MLNIDYANVEVCAKAVAENEDLVLGVKVRITDSVVGQNGLEPLRRAIKAAEMAGKSFRVMCHIGAAPGSLADLLDLLRPGDILTHSYSRAGNNTVQNGKLLPAALAAKKRGVIIDVGHGGGSFDYTVAEPAMAQGLTPDTISSDIHVVSINTPGYPTLPWVMSKFLNMGWSLEDVVAKAMLAPAKIIGRVPGLGTLQVGAPADVSIFDLVDGPVEFVDTKAQSSSDAHAGLSEGGLHGGRSTHMDPIRCRQCRGGYEQGQERLQLVLAWRPSWPVRSHPLAGRAEGSDRSGTEGFEFRRRAEVSVLRGVDKGRGRQMPLLWE